MTFQALNGIKLTQLELKSSRRVSLPYDSPDTGRTVRRRRSLMTVSVCIFNRFSGDICKAAGLLHYGRDDLPLRRHHAVLG